MHRVAMYNLTINGTKLTCPNLLPSKRDNYEWVIVVVPVHSKVFTAFADNARIYFDPLN